jgi:hypothetical protein
MNCEYVRNTYGVPACIGRKVAYKGRAGIISEDRGNYIGVTFDDEKPGKISNFHPQTEGIEYLGMGNIRKMTKSQERYRRYLEYGDGFRNFRDFLFWDSDPERSWNRCRA